MPAVAPVPSRRALSSARFAIFLTFAAWVAFGIDQMGRLTQAQFGPRIIFDAVVYIAIVTLLTLSAGAHLLARLGHLYRARDHERVPRALIDDHFAETMPALTVLVPSYREDARVVRQTLLSAALQEYAPIRVVLLVDDPPNPSDPDHVRMLMDARDLPGRVQALLAEPRARFEAELAAFEKKAATGAQVAVADMLHLATLYRDAANWLTDLGKAQERVDHSDDFLADAVFGRLAEDFENVSEALYNACRDGARLSGRRLTQLHRRLAVTFQAELTSFERKSFASLSHELNKAMNLNSYLGLMGGRYNIQQTPTGRVLLPALGERCDLEIPNTEYVLTLDADSTLLPEYCLRLVYLMEQPEHARVAVAQTPYSSYPGALTRIERIAGATTDLQHFVHQGLTRHGATFWVGANAVLRKRALDDIVEEEDRGGFRIRRYIQDRTVIEDTESSLDICSHGWELYNYPERLSYSATPPDFGSLCTQRQRWANGGLVILPKLFRLMRTRRKQGRRFPIVEMFLRANYLASICWASFGLIVLLAYPFNSRLLSPFAMLTALPYFAAMSTDLRRCGYRRRDALRVYGFNLLLLPVNVSGVVKSIGQAIGGQKIAFARTPKVRNRTVAPLAFVTIPYLVVGFSVYTVWRDISHGHQAHAAFAAVNAVLASYAIVAFVGLRHSLVDVWMNVLERLYKPATSGDKQQAWAPDWVTVLYHGATETGDASVTAPRAAALALMDQEPSLRGPRALSRASQTVAGSGSVSVVASAGASPSGDSPVGGSPVGGSPVAAKQTAASLDLRPLKTSYVDVDRMTLDRPEIGRSPAASGAAPVVADEVDLVAKAVTSYLRRMQDAGRIVLRLGEDGVELRLDTHDRAA
jgi:cellulose synthase/poly-beta-1,6-N-acetylglucosamine synthase-like glycosyltransferase